MDINDQALAWAQANPTDPRAQNVMAKAWAGKNPNDPRASAIMAKISGGKSGPLPGTPENPIDADLFGSDIDRTKSSFGDLQGITPMLTQKGYKKVQKNGSGDLVAQGPDGRYYRDQEGFSHPINYLEGHAGGALPTAGMVGGAALGTGAGPGAPVASTILAGAGAGAGEVARQAIGKQLGVQAQADPSVAGEEALKGSAAEVGGKALGKIPVPFMGMNIDEATKAGLQKLVQAGSRGAAKVSSMLTGVDSDAFLRMLNRPKQVAEALKPGNSLRVARAAQGELAARAETENKLISSARQNFQDNFGQTPVDTTPMQSSIDETLARNAPNSSGRSGLMPDEISELNDLKAKDFTGQQQTGTTTQTTTKQSPILGPDGQPLSTTTSAQVPTLVPVANKPAGELQRTADYLQEQVSPQAYKTVGPTRTGKSTGAFQDLLGKLKDSFHNLDPNGLGKADARFSDYADKVKLLGPVENDGTAESFATNLFGANKGVRREAAQSLIPKTYEDMADIGANKAMGTDPVHGLIKSPSGPAIVRVGGPLAMGLAGFASGGTERGLLGLGAGAGASVATSPIAHKEFYYLSGKYGMPAVRALVQNPQIAPAILDQADLGRIRGYGQNIWASLRSSQQGGK